MLDLTADVFNFYCNASPVNDNGVLIPHCNHLSRSWSGLYERVGIRRASENKFQTREEHETQTNAGKRQNR